MSIVDTLTEIWRMVKLQRESFFKMVEAGISLGILFAIWIVFIRGSFFRLSKIE
jgi:hypothetical protein